MKNALRLTALVGALVISLFATAKPLHAITPCESRDGAACPNVTDSYGFCYTSEDSCIYIYQCWCELNYQGIRAWRCASNPYSESCPV